MSWWLPLLGRPFDPDQFHCWHLVREALRARFDVDVPEHGGVASSDVVGIAAAVDQESDGWIAIEADDERPGDVLVFDYLRSPSHVGIVVADGLFLHVSEGIVSRVESHREAFWRRRLVGRWRHPALAGVHQAERVQRRGALG